MVEFVAYFPKNKIKKRELIMPVKLMSFSRNQWEKKFLNNENVAILCSKNNMHLNAKILWYSRKHIYLGKLSDLH